MALSVERIKTYRRWFGWAFVGSFLVFAIVLAFALMPDAPSGYRLPDDNRMYPPLKAEMVLALGFFVISFTTLIGFVVTMIVTWRKERLESNHTSIELEKKQPELEKLRREIADKNAAAQEKGRKPAREGASIKGALCARRNTREGLMKTLFTGFLLCAWILWQQHYINDKTIEVERLNAYGQEYNCKIRLTSFSKVKGSKAGR